MIALLLDTVAGYLLARFFSSKLLIMLMSLLAGAMTAFIGSYLVGLSLGDRPGVIVLDAVAVAPLHSIFIFLVALVNLWFGTRRLRIKAPKAEDEYLDANELDSIMAALGKYKALDLTTAPSDEKLERNLAQLSTDELIEKLEMKYFAEEALPSALRVLKSREQGSRGITKDHYSAILESVKAEEKASHDLPDRVDEEDLASPGIRLVAHFIDHTFALGLLILIGATSDDLVLLGLLAYMIYYIFSDALPGGKSLGKRVVGLRVIGLRGLKPCTPIQALKRNILMMIPVIGFLDMLTIFGHRYQRWGDRWAETIVVKYR